MTEPRISGITTNDLRAMVRVATTLVSGKPMRLPIELQIRSLAVTSLELRDLLARCLAGEADALATARMLVEHS